MQSQRIYYGYVVLAASLLILAAAGGLWSVFGVFFEPILTEFGWSRALLSGAVSTRMFVMALSGILAGRLTDRYGPKPVAICCALLLGLSFFLISKMNAVWQLYLLLGVTTGIGMCGIWIPMISTVSRWFIRRRGIMTGIVLSGSSLGMIIAPPIVSRLIISYGWRNSFVIIAVSVTIIVAGASLFLKRDPEQIGQLPDGNKEFVAETGASSFSLRKAMRTSQFWLFCGIFICIWFSANPIWVHIVIHAIDLGITPTSAANILAIMGASGLAGRLLVGGIADKYGYKKALFSGFILTSLSLFWLLTANHLWSLYLFAAVFGFGIAGLIVLESPVVAKLFGLNSLSVLVATVEFVSVVFSLPSPILAGYIHDSTGGYNLAFLICAIMSTLGLLLSWQLKIEDRPIK